MIDPLDAVGSFLRSDLITYERILGWFAIPRFIAIVLCIILGIGIIYFAIFTDYLYLRYFVNFDEYYTWKAKKKKAKKNEVTTPQPLIGHEFKASEEEILSHEEPTPINEWQRVFDRIAKNTEMDFKLAVIEADKILNKKFDDMGILGRNLRDKLENLPEDISKKIGKLGSARQVLDDLLKNDQLTISRETALKTIEIYQKAYMNLLS